MATVKKDAVQQVTITPPNFQEVHLNLVGIAPLMQCNFSQKARAKIRETQAAGSTAKGKKVREPRDFEGDYIGAMHISTEGWIGVPASAFRNAAIDVCRAAQFKMTLAKLSIFIDADGFDKIDGTPLVRIYGEPEKTEMMVRNATGVVDIRVRPMWREWSIKLRARFDADQFTAADVVNLIARAGLQCGIGEGRPYSKDSNGLGFGLFRVE